MVPFLVEIALHLTLGFLFGHLFTHLVKHETTGAQYEYIRYGVVLILSIAIGITILEIDHPYAGSLWAEVALWTILLGSMALFAWTEGRRKKLW